MLDLGSTDFNLAIPSVDAPQLEGLSTLLFDDWEAYVGQALALPDYSLFLQVEEGSINGWGKIGAAAAALYIGIGNYGDFASGLETISQQLRATRMYLAERANTRFSCPESKATVRKKGGVPVALERLFVRVQRGDLTPAEAASEAVLLLGDEGAETPGLMAAVSGALRSCPRYPEQVPLAFEEFRETPLIEMPSGKLPRSPKRRSPELPPPLHYRVEVWRESKKKQKQTKLTAL